MTLSALGTGLGPVKDSRVALGMTMSGNTTHIMCDHIALRTLCLVPRSLLFEVERLKAAPGAPDVKTARPPSPRALSPVTMVIKYPKRARQTTPKTPESRALHARHQRESKR